MDIISGKPRRSVEKKSVQIQRKCNFKPLERVYEEIICSMQTDVVINVHIYIYIHTCIYICTYTYVCKEMRLKKQLHGHLDPK